MSKTKNIRTCEYCRWYESFTGACTNGGSRHCADFVDNDNACNVWESKFEKYEILEYGDIFELDNGDECVLVRREIDTDGGIITQEIILINIFTGAEYHINLYTDNLEHSTDSKLNINSIVFKEVE